MIMMYGTAVCVKKPWTTDSQSFCSDKLLLTAHGIQGKIWRKVNATDHQLQISNGMVVRLLYVVWPFYTYQASLKI